MKLDKVTETIDARRRSYNDACGAAHALDLVGERWALLVIRELLLGPKRFGDLRDDLPGISANVLTQRLAGLEAAGIVRRRKLPPPASTQVYEVTEWGAETTPIFEVLGRWAARSPSHDPSLPLSANSLMLSFGTMFDPRAAGNLRAAIGFRIGASTYLVRIAAGAISVGRGEIAGADAVFSGAATAIAAVVYGGQSLAAMVASGALTLAGDPMLAARFTGLFPLPAKVERPDLAAR